MSTGDAERAFVEFVRTTATQLWKCAYWACGRNRVLADDILQDAFAKLWKAWPRIMDQDVDLYAYSVRVITNCAADFFRKQQRRVSEAPWDDEKGDRIPDAFNLADQFDFDAVRCDLRAAVATLEPIQQGLIHFIYVEQCSLAAASRKLGLTESTARRYHKAALSHLREMIGDEL
ncbi:RNA polymerase sigma factor [Streptomyces chartreusis]